MHRRTIITLGLWQVIKEELGKAVAVARYDAKEYGHIVRGHDGMSEEEIARVAKIRDAAKEAGTTSQSDQAEAARREALAAARAAQKQRAEDEQRAAAAAQEPAKGSPGGGDTQDADKAQADARAQADTARKATSIAEKWEQIKDSLMSTFGPKAGVAAIIDHCTRAHAAAVAVDLGIDVKSVQVQTQRSSVGEGSKVVGYIDAPAASQEEVMVFAERLQKACPAARTYGDIEWRQGPGPRR
jgi:hypothetical protein